MTALLRIPDDSLDDHEADERRLGDIRAAAISAAESRLAAARATEDTARRHLAEARRAQEGYLLRQQDAARRLHASGRDRRLAEVALDLARLASES